MNTRSYSSGDERPDVTVIMVSYNTAHLLDRLFASLNAAKGELDLQVIVVDNASSDNSVEILRKRLPNIELIENRTNVGFARANNQAVAQASGRYLLLLNTDAFLSPDTLQKTTEFMDSHPRCGVLGVRLVGPDGTLNESCRYFPTPWNLFLSGTGLGQFFPRTRLVDDMSWDHQSVRDCDWVPGCCYLVRREVIERIGLFDSRFFLYYEEVDHCRRVRQAGWTVTYYPFTQVVHLGGESAISVASVTQHGRQISALQVESELLYFRKHYGTLGVLAAVALNMFGSGMRACSALFRRLDIAPVAEAGRHIGTVLSKLIATRLASRPTR
jgi:N-acetylglucosaminyl-diphospho-decaprenol L-rhamnosyltransferase